MMRTKWYLLFNVWYKYCGCDDDDDDVCGMETQDDWVVSELWDMGFWSVNRLYVDNLRFPGIGKLYQNFGGNFGRLLYENCIKKKPVYFF
jgi:hypothetical protein